MTKKVEAYSGRSEVSIPVAAASVAGLEARNAERLKVARQVSQTPMNAAPDKFNRNAPIAAQENARAPVRPTGDAAVQAMMRGESVVPQASGVYRTSGTNQAIKVDPDGGSRGGGGGGQQPQSQAAAPVVGRPQTGMYPAKPVERAPLIPAGSVLALIGKNPVHCEFTRGSYWGPVPTGNYAQASRARYLPPAPWRNPQHGLKVFGGENTPHAGKRLAFPEDDHPFSAKHEYGSVPTTIAKEDWDKMRYEILMASVNLPLNRDLIALGRYNFTGSRGLT